MSAPLKLKRKAHSASAERRAAWQRNQVGGFIICRRVRGVQFTGRAYEAYHQGSGAASLVLSRKPGEEACAEYAVRLESTRHGVGLEFSGESAAHANLSELAGTLEGFAQVLRQLSEGAMARTALKGMARQQRTQRTVQRRLVAVAAALLLAVAATGLHACGSALPGSETAQARVSR